jgi:hypothetical protein
MFDLVVTPITNKFQVTMELYALLKDELSNNPDDTNSLTFINNGSTDGLHQRSFHTHDRIHYIGSKHKTKELILLNHALMRQNPEYADNQYILLLQPNTIIPKNYFRQVESAIKSNPDADVILGRVDHKIKNKIKKDVRVKRYEEFTTKSNSGATLKNFPPVREKSQKINEKATDSQTLTQSDINKTEFEIPAQNVSADFSSRLEEPQDAQFVQRAESISSTQVEKSDIVTKSVSDENCRAVHSDKICQCEKCVEKDTIKKVNTKSFNSKKVNSVVNDTPTIKKVNGDARCQSSDKICRQTENIFNIPRRSIHKFYSPHNILFKKDAIFKMGLFDIDYNFNQSAEILIHKLISLQEASVIYCDDFPVVQTGKIRKHRPNNEMIDKVGNFDFVYKDYIDKNVYKVISTGAPWEPHYKESVDALVILGSQHNEEIVALTKQQLSLTDKLIVTELPDNCSKKLQEIIASNYVEQYNIVIIVNPSSKFRYPHYIDDFKRYSAQMDWEGVLVSRSDFDVREITPGLAAEGDVSACFNAWNVFSPVVSEAVGLSEFLGKCSEQLDKTGRNLVASFLPKPVLKVPVLVDYEKGEGGEVTKAVDAVHKSSWYDWME